jgi:hypothetical protein
MTTRRYYSNTPPERTLSVSLTSSGTSATISGTFAGWPASFPYFAVLEIGTTNAEIVSVTNVSGSVATIIRGQDGTIAVAHSGGATFDQVVIAKDFDEANAHTSANSGVHGISGSVVGTTDAQTLTNKTLTTPSITAPAITGAGTAALASLSTTGNATVGGTLGVTGNETVGGTLAVTGSATIAGVNSSSAFFYGTQAAASSLANGAFTPVVIDTATVNPAGWTLAAGLVTVPSAGTYKVSGLVAFTGNATGVRAATLNMNGVEITGARAQLPFAGVSNSYNLPTADVYVVVPVGGTLAVVGYQNSGGALNTAVSSGIASSITIQRVA